MPFRLVQLSDTHISRSHPFFFHNWDVAVEAVNALAPDLVIVSGDVSFNGPENADDLTFAAAELERLAAPTHATPGNHDIGYTPGTGAAQEMTAARRNAWLAAFGPDVWTVDHADWRFVGLNPFLPGSGHAAEAEQDARLTAALETDRHVGVFTHVPLFAHQPDETDETTTATLRPAARAALLARMAGRVRFVASGHLHRFKRMQFDGIDYVWAPGTAFMSTGERSEAWGGEPWVGFLDWRFDGTDYTVDVVEPQDMLNIDLRNWARNDAHRYFDIAKQPYRAPVQPRLAENA